MVQESVLFLKLLLLKGSFLLLELFNVTHLAGDCFRGEIIPPLLELSVDLLLCILHQSFFLSNSFPLLQIGFFLDVVGRSFHDLHPHLLLFRLLLSMLLSVLE